MPPSTATELVDQLEDFGFVTRRQNPADGRQRLVLLSPSGKRVAVPTAARL